MNLFENLESVKFNENNSYSNFEEMDLSKTKQITKVKKFKKRCYQVAAVNKVMNAYSSGFKKMMLWLPTGAGKTVISAFIIEKFLKINSKNRVLFLAHRKEILDQTKLKIESQIQDITIEIEQGKRNGLGDSQIVIASIQSLKGRLEKYDKDDFDLIICDVKFPKKNGDILVSSSV